MFFIIFINGKKVCIISNCHNKSIQRFRYLNSNNILANLLLVD